MNYQIGLSGLTLAQRAIELIGTNMSNASTDNYHKQDLTVVPDEYVASDRVSLGGVRIIGSRRCIDVLIEKEMLRQDVAYSQVSRELSTLSTIESTMGTLASDGIAKSIEDFFNAMNELAAQPDSSAYQTQALYAGQTLVEQFNNLGQYIDQLLQDLDTEIKNYVGTEEGEPQGDINQLLSDIADLNQQIAVAESQGGSANLLADQRDQLINALGELTDVRVTQPDPASNVVNLTIFDMPAVVGPNAMQFDVALQSTDDGLQLGISIKGDNYYRYGFTGGKVGAIMNLRNNLVPAIKDQLNTLADEIVNGINAIHVQGIGASGSFDELTGVSLSSTSTALVDMGLGITTGTSQLRQMDSDGNVIIYNINVGTATTLGDIRDMINSGTGMAAIYPGTSTADYPSHLSAEIVGEALCITAEDGYSFDFLPVSVVRTSVTTAENTPDPAPYVTPSWSGTAAAPVVSGIYTGSVNETYSCTISGSGQIGVDDGITMQIVDHDGNLVKTMSLGAGYVAGSEVEISDGLNVSIPAGMVFSGESFSIQAMANSDSSGLYRGLGMNTFFSGTDISNLAVRSDVMADPGRLAFARGTTGLDNQNASLMVALGDSELTALGGKTISDYCQSIVTDLGEEISTRNTRISTIKAVSDELDAQQADVSGVDINEQAASMIMYEKMFQSMAKYITTLNTAFQSLINMI